MTAAVIERAATTASQTRKTKTWLDSLTPEQATELRDLRARFQAGAVEFSGRCLAASICSVLKLRVATKTVSQWLAEKTR